MANDKDDLLDPAEIEALLNTAAGAAEFQGRRARRPPRTSPEITDPALHGAPQPGSTGNVDALFGQTPPGGIPAGDPESLVERAAADLAEAVAPDFNPSGHRGVSPRPFEFQPFDHSPSAEPTGDLGNLKDVELDLRIELGRTELLIEEVLKLREGSVVALDKLAGDPVDILVNGRLIARGEVLVLNDNFCVRIAEILAPAQL